MSDELENMTPNQRRALNKALSALEAMAGLWAAEIRLTEMAQRIADVTDAAERAKRIAAFVEQGFIEGAYRHYIDHKDQIAALESENKELGEFVVAVGGFRGNSRSTLIGEHSLSENINRAFAELKSAQAVCDSYAEENQRLSDRIAALESAAKATGQSVALQDREAIQYMIESGKEDIKAANERLALVTSINASYVKEITALRSRVATLKAAVDAQPTYLPCPICNGVEGCDHTIPERRRAAEKPIYQQRVSDFNAAWRDVSKECFDECSAIDTFETRIIYAAPAATDNGGGRDAQLEAALRQIAEQEHIELMLDPTWAQRVAIAALSQKGEK